MVFLNIHAWGQYKDTPFWDTNWNIFNSFFTLVWAFFIIVYPIYSFVVIMKNKDNLGSEQNLLKYGVLYEEQKYTNVHGALLNVRAMVRRIFMVLVIVAFEDLPFF